MKQERYEGSELQRKRRWKRHSERTRGLESNFRIQGGVRSLPAYVQCSPAIWGHPCWVCLEQMLIFMLPVQPQHRVLRTSARILAVHSCHTCCCRTLSPPSKDLSAKCCHLLGPGRGALADTCWPRKESDFLGRRPSTKHFVQGCPN